MPFGDIVAVYFENHVKYIESVEKVQEFTNIG
jgi:hypothetical protein